MGNCFYKKQQLAKVMPQNNIGGDVTSVVKE
jgi:hypothetical protein